MPFFRDYKPGQTFSLPGFLVQYEYSDTPMWMSCEMNSGGYVTICPFNLQFTVPAHFNATAAELTSLDKAMEQAATAYHTTIADLRAKKEALLQLTCSNTDGLVEPAPADIPPAPLKDIDDDIPF